MSRFQIQLNPTCFPSQKVLLAGSGPGDGEKDPSSALGLQKLKSWFLFSCPFPPLLFCLALLFVPNVFLTYWPIHLHFSITLLQPKWTCTCTMADGHIHKHLTNIVTRRTVAGGLRRKDETEEEEVIDVSCLAKSVITSTCAFH